MKIRTEWVDEYNPYDELLDDVVASYELRKTGHDGRTGKIDNGDETQFVAMNHTNPLNQIRYDKKILADTTSTIHTGSILEFDGQKWLVISKIYDRKAYKVASVKLVEHFITVYKNGVSSTIPACVDSSVQLFRMGTNETRLVELPKGTIIMYVPDNDTTALMEVGEVYKIGRKNYKINDNPEVLNPGVIVLYMERTTESPDDIPEPTPPSDFEIVGADRILKGESESYSVDHDEQVTFSITGTFATIIKQENNSCAVEAGSNIGEVTLAATAGEVSVSRVIRIVGLF